MYRWLRVGTLGEDLIDVDIPIRISTGHDDVKRKKQMTEHECAERFSRITSELTELPEARFQAALDGLEMWWGKLRQGGISATESAKVSEQPPVSDEDVMPTLVAPTQTEKTTPVEVREDPPRRKKKRAGSQKKRGTPIQSSEAAAKAASDLEIGPFNPRAKRVGRPSKNRAAEQAKVSEERKEYNIGAKLRNVLRGEDVVKVEEYVKSCKSPLKELSSYLRTFEERYRGHKAKTMKL
ncbi:hypothetical protein PRNP1_002626 [Phytophthora ramorum]